MPRALTAFHRRMARDPLRLGGAVVLAGILVVLGRAYVQVGILHSASSAFHASAAWGLLLLASFCGLGSMVDALRSKRHPPADWGLRCAWGWAAAVAVGGLLCAFEAAKAAALVALAGAGLVFLGVDLVQRWRRWRPRSPLRRGRLLVAELPFAAGLAAISALAYVAYLASIVNRDFNDNDDRLCYFGFAREILQRGTLTQPFSLRRASAYGAKSLLDAMQLAIPVTDRHLHMLDGGMALLTMLALIVGHARSHRRASRVVVMLLLLVTVTMPEIRLNTGATMTGAIFFLALYRTFTMRPVREAHVWRDAVPVALVAAGTAALRQNYLVPMGLMLAFEYGRPIVTGSSLRPFRVDRPAIERAAAALGLLCLFLVPWWVLSQRWSGTFLFPLVWGYFNPAYGLFSPLSKFAELKYIWENACFCLPVKAVPLLLVAVLGSNPGRRPPAFSHFVIAVFLSFAVLLRAVPDADPPTLGRYYFGFTFPALVAIALELASDRRGQGRRPERIPVQALVVAALALQIYGDREATMQSFDRALTQLEPEYMSPAPWTPPDEDAKYKELQDAIPAGEPIIVMVDEAARFDFARNRIESLDVVGAVAPPPGLPLSRGGDVVARYLVSLGYRYAIVVHPDAAFYLYRRDTWTRNLTAPTFPIWGRTARSYLDAFDDFDSLRKTRAHVADTPTMTALDLTREAPAAP